MGLDAFRLRCWLANASSGCGAPGREGISAVGEPIISSSSWNWACFLEELPSSSQMMVVRLGFSRSIIWRSASRVLACTGRGGGRRSPTGLEVGGRAGDGVTVRRAVVGLRAVVGFRADFLADRSRPPRALSLAARASRNRARRSGSSSTESSSSIIRRFLEAPSSPHTMVVRFFSGIPANASTSAASTSLASESMPTVFWGA